MNNEIQSFNISTRIIEGYQIISFEGKLIYGNTQTAKQEIRDQLQDSNGYILNMDKLGYIDSTGLGVIMNLGKQVYSNNKKLVIVLQDQFIKELFMISKFNTVFLIVDSEQKAVEALKKGFKTDIDLNSY